MFGFIKKVKQYIQVKSIVKDGERFEKKCKLVRDNITLKKMVDEMVYSYNKKNKGDIPQSVVDILYKLGQAAADGKLKNGTVKKELAIELVKIVLGVVGKLAEYLISKAVLKV